MSIGTIIVLALLLVALFFLGRSTLAELILIFDKDRFKREVSQRSCSPHDENFFLQKH